jgi:two-component system, sensor histidine kinase PdtaS
MFILLVAPTVTELNVVCGPDSRIAVSLRGGHDGQVCIRVRDNGVGLPPGFDWTKAGSMGLRVVQILARQLDATVEVCNDKGTKFSVAFEKKKTAERRRP